MQYDTKAAESFEYGVEEPSKVMDNYGVPVYFTRWVDGDMWCWVYHDDDIFGPLTAHEAVSEYGLRV